MNQISDNRDNSKKPNAKFWKRIRLIWGWRKGEGENTSHSLSNTGHL